MKEFHCQQTFRSAALTPGIIRLLRQTPFARAPSPKRRWTRLCQSRTKHNHRKAQVYHPQGFHIPFGISPSQGLKHRQGSAVLTRQKDTPSNEREEHLFTVISFTHLCGPTGKTTFLASTVQSPFRTTASPFTKQKLHKILDFYLPASPFAAHKNISPK